MGMIYTRKSKIMKVNSLKKAIYKKFYEKQEKIY